MGRVRHPGGDCVDDCQTVLKGYNNALLNALLDMVEAARTGQPLAK
jgi:hypothetical protein